MSTTILKGIRCPKCGSFIKIGQKKCEVCLYDLKPEDEIPLEKKIEKKPLKDAEYKKCPKCNTLNESQARYCKHCREPLKEIELISDQISILLNWVSTSQKTTGLPQEIYLNPFLPYYKGVGEWSGYGFMVYSSKSLNKIIIRRLKENNNEKIYAKINSAIIVESGIEFYLGAVGFQLLGSLRAKKQSDKGEKTKILVKTAQVGPGLNIENVLLGGDPKLRIINVDIENSFFPINSETILGREFLKENTLIDPSALAGLGVSDKHLIITPMEGGTWLLAPMPDKYFYIEILENPIILAENSVIRYVFGMQDAAEASLLINTKGGKKC